MLTLFCLSALVATAVAAQVTAERRDRSRMTGSAPLPAHERPYHLAVRHNSKMPLWAHH